MTEINEYVEAEFESIERLLAELPPPDALENLSGLELSGTAAILHGFYNGVENVIKQVLHNRGGCVPRGSSWHRDLVTQAVTSGVISEPTAEALKGYLAFRHFFSHAYAFDLDKERIVPLVRRVPEVLLRFRNEVEQSLRTQ